VQKPEVATKPLNRPQHIELQSLPAPQCVRAVPGRAPIWHQNQEDKPRARSNDRFRPLDKSEDVRRTITLEPGIVDKFAH